MARTDNRVAAFAVAKCLREGRKVHEESGDVGKFIKRELVKETSHPGRGRTYTTEFYMKGGKLRRGKPRPPHRASLPGQPPAPDSGTLRRSFKYRTKRLPLGAEVNVGTDYEVARYLEYGTRRMLARPFFRPTMLRIRPKISVIWKNGIVRRERLKARELGGRG